MIIEDGVMNKNIPLYYEYLYINDLDDNYHLISIDNENLNILIPAHYNINYSKSTSYKGIGHIYFNYDKSRYTIDYIKEDYPKFECRVDNVKKNIKRQFINFMGQEYYEIFKDDRDLIYMYNSGYSYRITSDHKLTINEYFDMYIILFSISNTNLRSNYELLTSLCILNRDGINSYINDDDLLNKDLTSINTNIKIDLKSVLISNDDEYLDYKDKQSKLDIISANIIDRHDDIYAYYNDRWLFKGIFKFNYLGNYNDGIISEYDIITDSDLDSKEVVETLTKIVNDKQLEVNSNEEIIKNNLLEFIYNYLVNNINYELWDKYHLREFINTSLLTSDDVSDQDMYNLFYNYLTGTTSYDIFDAKKIKESMQGISMIIYPERYEILFSSMNYMIDKFSVTINDKYEIIP